MAGLKCVACSGSQATSTSAETILQLTAAANHRVVVTGFSMTVAGTSAVDVIMRILRQSGAQTAGTTTGLISKLDSAVDDTVQTTAATNFSSEPATPGDVLQLKRLQGSFEKYFPMGQEIVIPGGGKLGLEVTTAVGSTISAEFYFEE
jgi:hypothetical protein